MNDFDYSPPRERGQIGDLAVPVQKVQKIEPTTATTAVGPQPSQKESPVTSSQNNISRQNAPSLGECLTKFVSHVVTQLADGVREFLEAIGKSIRTLADQVRHDYDTWTSDSLLQERPATLVEQVRQSEQPSAPPWFIRWPVAIVVIVYLLLRLSTAGDVSFSIVDEINVESPQFYTNFDTLNQNCSRP